MNINFDIVMITDAQNPLWVRPFDVCMIPGCPRKAKIRGRFKTSTSDHIYEGSMCVWHRMACGQMNSFLFNAVTGELLPEYIPTVIEGLLCFPKMERMEYNKDYEVNDG